MNIYHKYNLLLKTYVDVDSRLTDLTQWISAEKYLEIGDDPHLVQQLEDSLLKILHRVRSLEPYFDLAITPLSKANIYFDLVKSVKEVLQFLREVQKREYGSHRHTLELLDRLNACIINLEAIGDLVAVKSDTVH